MVPSDENCFWGYTRYVTGCELSPELPPMRAFALKARVDHGPGTLAMEVCVARALHVSTCVYTYRQV